MGVVNGFRSLFFGEEEIEAEEYAAYQPQAANAKPAAQPQTQASAQTSYEIPQPAPSRSTMSAYEAENPARMNTQTQSTQSRRQTQYSSRTSTNGSSRGRQRDRESEVQMDTMAQSSFDLVLARPNNFKEVEKIGTDVNQGRTVILNLELVKLDDATRILDFLWGVAFANDDEIKMMAQKTYAIIPRNVNFSGVDLVSELENNGYSF
ncbi:MAG: cell division protein SepF [Ruminococcus sp.]|nr:cell division protein SepF [Ruminococcus sp.]